MEKIQYLFSRLQNSLDKSNFNIFLKPKQVLCFENLLDGNDVLAVLPTGFGKSLIYQLLPTFLPTRSLSNIVIVVTPLNSIIEDQMNVLRSKSK